jgi:hypothetical protein
VLGLDADDGAGERAGLGGAALLQDDLDLLAAGLVENVGQGGVGVEVDGEGLQRLLDRVVAVVGDGADLAPPRSCSTRLFSKSLMSCTGKDRSTRALPLTLPAR